MSQRRPTGLLRAAGGRSDGYPPPCRPLLGVASAASRAGGPPATWFWSLGALVGMLRQALAREASTYPQRKSSSSLRFIDSGLEFTFKFNGLGRVIATRRVHCCDISGAEMRHMGWSAATNRVRSAGCDKTGAAATTGSFKGVSANEIEEFYAYTRHNRAPLAVSNAGYCDISGASQTRHGAQACRNIIP